MRRKFLLHFILNDISQIGNLHVSGSQRSQNRYNCFLRISRLNMPTKTAEMPSFPNNFREFAAKMATQGRLSS
jgi:hypothetical protein